MINSSSALPHSSAFICKFCASTSYVYCKFKNYIPNIDEAFYSENDAETSQSSDNQKFRQILPITSESEQSFNTLTLDTSEINRSEVVGSSNKKQLEMYLSGKPLKKTTNINLDNNFGICSKKLDVPKISVKRKLFDTVTPEILVKKPTLKSKNVNDETYKFLPELSDSVADNFLQKFDEEIGFGSVGESVNNLAQGFSKTKQDDLSKECNLNSRRNLSTGTANRNQRKEASLLKGEFFSPFEGSDSNGDKDFQIDRSDESSNSDGTKSTEKNDNLDIRKKINFRVRSNSRSSVCSDTDSISSITSNISRYGRIRKPSSIYINAAMFKGSVKKSAEIEHKATTLINSHKCQSGPSRSVQATANYCPDQFDILSHKTPKRMVSSQFKKSASKISPFKNRQTIRKSQNNTRISSWRNSSFIDELAELPHNKKVLLLDKPTEQTTSSADESNLNNENLGLQNRTSRQSALISDYTEQLNLNQSPSSSITCSQCKQITPVIRGLSPEKDIFKKPLAMNKFRNIQPLKVNETSPKSQKIVGNSCGRKIDPNEIHAVVKDEVISFKWYSTTPDFDSVFGNGTNVYYSMCDLKSYYTNMTVGYLRIDAGHKKPMTVLKNYILLYFVERGEGIFQVSGRKIAGQIGSTVFIPLGVEYAITNSNTEEDLILKFVIISPII